MIFLINLYWPTAREGVRLYSVLAWHVFADVITIMYGSPDNSTIRVDHHKPEAFAKKVMKGAYSFAQITATAALIDSTHPDVAFGVLIGIHYAAFLMTLSRKNIISSFGYNFGYTLSLVLAGVVICSHLGTHFLLTGLILTITRMLGCNKYLLWILFGYRSAI